MYIHIYMMEYYSALQKKEVLSYAATWMNLEEILLNEISQSQRTNTLLFHSREVSKVVKVIEKGGVVFKSAEEVRGPIRV